MRRFLILGSILILLGTALVAADKKSTDTPKATATRKKLKEKVASVDWDETPLKEAIDLLNDEVKGLGLRLDNAGGVSNNIKITYKGEKKTVAEVLDGMLKKPALGYVVISKKGNAYDGTILIKQGKERGYPLGEEPEKMDAKDKDGDKDKADDEKPAKTKSKDKSAKKDKAEPKDKDKPAKETSEDDPEKVEKEAERLLGFAKLLLDDGKTDKAKTRLKDIVSKYPKTKAAEAAQKLLKDLDK